MAATTRILRQALKEHHAGNLGQARTLYCQVLEKDPRSADAWHLLGTIAYQAGDHRLAIELIRRALALCETNADYHNNLGAALRGAGDLKGATASYRRALELRPNYVDALNSLGVVLAEQKDPAAAIGYLEKALSLQPDHELALSNLGNALQMQHRLEDAIELYQRALAKNPQSAAAHNNLGQALQLLGRLDEAAAAFREALRLRPDLLEGYVNLGAVLQRLGDTDEALRCLRRALELRPNQPSAYNNLGNILRDLGQYDDSEACYREAMRLRPDYALACNNIGTLYQVQGRFAESVPWYRQALKIEPTFTDFYSNLLFALNYDPTVDVDTLFVEHRGYGLYQERLAPPPRPHANEPNPERRLRVGYVSPDLRDHAIARFVEPILAHHDPAQVEVFCYAEVAKPDHVTARLQALVPNWRSTCGHSDHRIADMVRADGIDILVDLAGHTAGQRLRMFTYRPAPVQATYLGYPNTTGLSCIDYYLTDAIFHPPGEPARCTEAPVRLERGICVFQPPDHAPSVGPLPALHNGRLTFGSLHNLTKLNERVLDLWSDVLRAVPTARLLVFRDTLHGETRQRLRRQFVERGIAEERLDLRHGHSVAGYLGVYNEIDITLDVFPWGGGTTGFESLWMGVPVLTVRGSRFSERGATSALTYLDLPEFIADSREDFVARAVRLAADVERLARVRAELRARMTATLCDGHAFTRCLEDAYRTMWGTWCAGQATRRSA